MDVEPAPTPDEEAKDGLSTLTEWTGVLTEVEGGKVPFIMTIRWRNLLSGVIIGELKFPTRLKTTVQIIGTIVGENLTFREVEVISGKKDLCGYTALVTKQGIKGKSDVGATFDLCFTKNLPKVPFPFIAPGFSLEGAAHQENEFSLQFDKVKVSQGATSITGTMTRPNSVTKIKGIISDDRSVEYEEHELVSGENKNLTTYYKGTYSDSKITGKVLDNDGNHVGPFAMDIKSSKK